MKGSCSFLKKSTKKLLSVGCGGRSRRRAQEQKFFASFF
jgi:hypothetical protein